MVRELPRWKSALVMSLLSVSAVFNVIALLPSVAFLELKGLLLPGPYSILKVIELLWDHHLYPLVVLVVGFSVLFPPVKIALSTKALLGPMTPAGRGKLLSAVGHLGRWSLLDVFVALLLLIITAKQSFTGSTVSFGLYAFVTAIVLSMTAASILHEANHKACHDGRPATSNLEGRPLVQTAGPAGWLVIPAVVAAVLLLYQAVVVPMFKVDKFGLMSNDWSLMMAMDEFAGQGLMMFALVMAAFLILAPVAFTLCCVVCIMAPMRPSVRHVTERVLHHAYEWCMLDVYLLAMVLYLSEETSFAPLNLKGGFTYLIEAMVMLHVVRFLVWRATLRAGKVAARVPST